VLPLADVQAGLRDALVAGDAARVLPLLVGGRDPCRRLAVHQRHYLASLVAALAGKFPATAWLVGAPFVEDAARAFVRQHPPAAPCIAEFGGRFPDFIAAAPGAEQAPYLRDFAMLEWHLGHAAVAVEHAAIAMSALSAYSAEALVELTVLLQPGVSYLATDWPVDELIRLYLEGSAPDRYSAEPTPAWIEIRGARGVFAMTRCNAATFAFRRVLQAGLTIGAAAELALAIDNAFDPGMAFAAVMSEGLAVAIEAGTAGAMS
jgi:hypothetical protein